MNGSTTNRLIKDKRIPTNPYKYLGPLDPVKDKLVLVPRTDDLNWVVQKVLSGGYWSILGPRQIGKTTFLRQVQDKFHHAYSIYFDFEICPTKEENFYRWLMEQVTEKVPSKIKKSRDIGHYLETDTPEVGFFNFLEKFKPKNEKTKIILLFDEIDRLPHLETFLRTWRKVFHDRYHTRELARYAVIVTGAADLIGLTLGENSPFNIADTLYLRDFSLEESEGLIEKPFKKLNIAIEKEARNKLISQLSGHPQMLQQTCHNLVDMAIREKRVITGEDVERAIHALLAGNTSINTLKNDLEKSRELEGLVRQILDGKEINYRPYRDYSIKNSGAIIENVRDGNSFCAIRNDVYAGYLKEIIESRFVELEKVGAGGMGTVYKARDIRLGRTVAIKKISARLTRDKDRVETFLKEAQITAQLKHANIVRVYDIEQVKEDCHIIMEFIEGENYKEIIEKQKMLELAEVLSVGKRLFSALSYAHGKGVIHRDIKPHNIIKDRESGIKIVDFGIAIIAETGDPGSEPGSIIGSMYYMSPEQVKGEQVDARSDIYSAGATMFELVTGRVPFDGDPLQIYNRHLSEPIPPIRQLRPGIPFELAEIIEKCMQKEKKDRYQDASEVLKDIEAVEKMLEKQNRETDNNTEPIAYETVHASGDITQEVKVPGNKMNRNIKKSKKTGGGT